MEVEGIASGSTGNPMDLKEIFYTNLLLLEFDAEAQEAKYRIPFNRLDHLLHLLRNSKHNNMRKSIWH
jgi:hypothetical protein